MGSRQARTERTRACILGAAMELFDAGGYDDTTMEQIAACAQVGIATLYRYFPSKDLILLTPVLERVGLLAAHLRDRPAVEPLPEALGQAVLGYLAANDAEADAVDRLRTRLDRAPGPRARLWDVWARERSLLAEAIAARSGVDPAEVWVHASAHVALMIVEMALDQRRAVPGLRAADEAKRIIGLIESETVVFPRPHR